MHPILPDPSRSFSRRALLQKAGLSLAAVSLPSVLPTSGAFAAEPKKAVATKVPPAPLAPLNRFPRMTQEYYVRRLREIEARADQRRAALKTKADAEAYVRDVRAKIRRCFGPWPEKTPLNARVTGVVERDTYHIENVIFESRPDFLVTANLYLPKGRAFPLPGVVGSCGHSENGKAEKVYQFFAQGLARQGYVCLVFDPIGQGERLQYPDDKLKSRYGAGVFEHLHAGNQQFLVGENFAFWRAWDGIRALDYLLTRPEVDPRHVGVTGNSGGGTMTTWLCGVEPRWTMAAPSCFVTTFRRNLENELPADTEQYPPRALALGLDHSDFLAAMAPKPVIILAGELDFFDVRGSEETYARLKPLYRLLGAEENISLFVGPKPHGYSQENREAMYRWFNRATTVSTAQTEPELVTEQDKTLQCTPSGQVADLKARTVFSFTSELSRHFAAKRAKLSGDKLAAAISATLKLPPRGGVLDYRILRTVFGRRYPQPQVTHYAVETEPGIHALVSRLAEERHLSRPPQAGGRAVLYVSHHSADAELREEPLIAELLNTEPQAAFYACDVRGIGESRPNTCGQDMFLDPYGNDYFYAGHSLMLDEPYVGRRTHDLLCVLDWLAAQGHAEVHLAGKGWGAIPTTFAALLSALVKRVTLKHALTSYATLAEAEHHQWPLAALLPGALEHFDLPDCYRALATKGLSMIEPWGAALNRKSAD